MIWAGGTYKKGRQCSSLHSQLLLDCKRWPILPTVWQMWPKPKRRQTCRTFLTDLRITPNAWLSLKRRRQHLEWTCHSPRQHKGSAQGKADSFSGAPTPGKPFWRKNPRTVNELTLYIDEQKHSASNDSYLWMIALQAFSFFFGWVFPTIFNLKN